MTLPDLSSLALTGAIFALSVQARARVDLIEVAVDDTLTARVTAPPVEGRANDAVRKLLACALGVAPSRLTLIRGETARDKVFRLD